MKMTQVGILIGAAVLFVAVRTLMAKPDGAEKARAKEKIKQGARVIDVRTAGEFATGHHPAATNIPLQELSGRLSSLGDKNQAIVVYCASGMRSSQAQKILKAAGYTDVTNAGGIGDLGL